MIRMVIKSLKTAYNKLQRFYELSKYNDFTIAEYFRKQGAKIGDDCWFSIRDLAPEPYLVEIGNHVAIAMNVQLLTHNLGWCFRDEVPDLQVFEKIKIGDNCNIGPNTVILPGVVIGKNCIIGAGSVVTKDVPSNSIVGGNPAKVIGDINKYKEKAMRLWKEQRPPDYLKELNQGEKYSWSYIHQLKLRDRALLKKHLMEYFSKKDQ